MAGKWPLRKMTVTAVAAARTGRGASTRGPHKVHRFRRASATSICVASLWGWKVLGYARRFKAEIVNYADDLRVLGKAPAAEMLAAVETLLERLKLTVNAEKIHCCRAPEESVEFLGYRIGRNYRRDTGRAYIGMRPSAGECSQHPPSRA